MMYITRPPSSKTLVVFSASLVTSCTVVIILFIFMCPQIWTYIFFITPPAVTDAKPSQLPNHSFQFFSLNVVSLFPSLSNIPHKHSPSQSFIHSFKFFVSCLYALLAVFQFHYYGHPQRSFVNRSQQGLISPEKIRTNFQRTNWATNQLIWWKKAGHTLCIFPHTYPDHNTWQMYGLIVILHVVPCTYGDLWRKNTYNALFLLIHNISNKGIKHKIQ